MTSIEIIGCKKETVCELMQGDYIAKAELINDAISQLSKPGDTATITAEMIGRDMNDEEVARFYFTWSFRVR